MQQIKRLSAILLIMLWVSVCLPFQGLAETDRSGEKGLSVCQLEKTLAGAVEDQSWMYAKSKEEVRGILVNYYAEPLLEELVSKCWDFIKEPTDWYSIAQLKTMVVVSNDGKDAVARAVIGIEDVDTGNNENIQALFKLTNISGKWKVHDSCYQWNQ